MTDLRACAEFIVANVDRLEVHAKRRHEQLTELEIRSRDMARAVLSSLDVPKNVENALGRLRQLKERQALGTKAVAELYGIDINSTACNYSISEKITLDRRTVSDHFLAHPIRIDVPDREQLMADLETVGQVSHVDGVWYDPMGVYISDSDYVEAVNRLAAHTRRTLGEK